MNLRADQLQQSLSEKLLPIYLVSGDEPLLSGEAVDSIRSAARSAGYAERQVFHADSIDWNQFTAESQAMSLFAEKRVFELRMENSKPGDKGSKALVSYAASAPDDILLLVVCKKLDRSQQNSKWAKALNTAGAHIQVWPVEAKHMSRWLDQRLKRHNITADPDALHLLAERVEGNLLAAQQEIEKLALLVKGRLDLATLQNAVMDSARFDVFSLADRMLAGDATSALRTLDGLREEGSEATLVSWTFVRELRQLFKVQDAVAQGLSLEAAIRQAGVWSKKQPLVHRAAKRLPAEQLKRLLLLAREADQQIKGRKQGDAWLTLRECVLGFSGAPIKRGLVG